MLRDLVMGGVLGVALAVWRNRSPNAVVPSGALQQGPIQQQLQTWQQQLSDVRQALAIAQIKQSEAETQIAELNQLATDRAIELIQLQADNADLLAQIAQLSQKRTRKKRTPKVTQDGTEPTVESVALQSTPLELDLTLVQQKQAESVAAAQLLQPIFAEEKVAVLIPSTLAHETLSNVQLTISGLDAAHSCFLKLLSQQPQWSRTELSQAAQQTNLLLDGALEVINDAAFERCDEALTDGEDPVKINPDVLQELLS